MVHMRENSAPRPSQILYFTFIALLFLVFPSSNAFWGSSEDSLWQEAEDTFLGEIQRLEGKFPMQSEETWLQITSTIANTLQAKPPQHPAVITALLPPDLDISFSTCFVHSIGVAVNKAVAPILKSGKPVAAPLTITSQSFDKQSITNIRQNIETYFKTEGKALLVLDIQNFTNSDNLQVFHGLCDNYNSVDPRATILFPVQVPQHIYEKYRPWRHSMGGAISNEVLTEAWENVVNQNTGPALIARVADAVILLNGGDTCKEIQIEENEVFIDNTISGDGGPKEVTTMERQLSKITVNVQNLEKVVAANHIDNKNDFLAIMKETKKLQDRILDIEFKLDAFIITERQAHEAERLDFHNFKIRMYFALGFLVVVQLVILWKVLNLTNIIHPILQQFLSAADVSSDGVQYEEKGVTKIPKGTVDSNSPYSSDEEAKEQKVGNNNDRKRK